MRPAYVEIDLSAVAHNITQIKKKIGPAKIMAVIKANAYGHGVGPIARTALNNGASYLGVSILEEGFELREQGFTEPILVFGGEIEQYLLDIFDYNLEITLFSERLCSQLTKLAKKKRKKVKVHVKVDTGMGRVGVVWEKAVSFIEMVSQLEEIDIVGIYTHFATADEKDKTYAHLQLSRFNTVLKTLEEKGINIPLIHAANSGAILDLPKSYFNLVRPGILMYGYYPSDQTTESVSLIPAMTFKSKVSFLKQVPAGTGVSYGQTYKTKAVTKIATIPVGYADGYNRLLSNKAQVVIKGKKYPVVGRVCMDLIMVDLGLDNDIDVGDEVILFGTNNDEEFSVYDICRLVDTIPYEVCCWISQRVPRIYKS
jgi:alanine racemase